MQRGEHTEHIAFFFFARVLPHITLYNVFCCQSFVIANHTQFIRCIYLVICQDLQQVMVSGPNLNETSIVSGGYGGPAGGIIPTSSIKGTARNFKTPCFTDFVLFLILHTDLIYKVYYSGVIYPISDTLTFNSR